MAVPRWLLLAVCAVAAGPAIADGTDDTAALGAKPEHPEHLMQKYWKYHSDPEFMLLVARMASFKAGGGALPGGMGSKSAATYKRVKRSKVGLSRTPPSGAVEKVDETVISGWASDPDYPAGPVAVLIHRKGALLATLVANEKQPDSTSSELQRTAGFGRHGFSCRLDWLERTVGRGLPDLVLSELTFSAVGVDADGVPDIAVPLPVATQALSAGADGSNMYSRAAPAAARLPVSSYSGVMLWPHQEFLSFFHDLLPNANQQPMYTPSSDRAMFVERDLGGWNNIRMGYEMAVSLAYKTRRPLALPNGMSRFYLVDAAPAWIFDYFDLDHFKRAIPTTDHFTPRDPDVYEVPSKFSTATTNKEFPGFDQLPADQHWYFGDSTKGAVRLFGQYTERPEFQPKPEWVRVVHAAFRMRRDVIDKAIAVLRAHHLQPYGYNAMHVRRNDFQYEDVRQVSHQQIYDHVKDDIKGEVLLIISDEYNQDLKELMERSASRVVFWKCGEQTSRCPKEQMVIDMLAAVPAKRFFGSPLSTFSAGIVQWRNRLRPDVSQQFTMPYTRDMERLPTWGRAGELALKPTLGAVFRDAGYEALRVQREAHDILRDFASLDTHPWARDGALEAVHQLSAVKWLPAELLKELDHLLRPMLEQWTGFKLVRAGDTGFLRKYSAGASLPATADEPGSPVPAIHAIIVVRQVDEAGAKVPNLQVSGRHGRGAGLGFGVGYMLFVATAACPWTRRAHESGEFIEYAAGYNPANWNDCSEHCEP